MSEKELSLGSAARVGDAAAMFRVRQEHAIYARPRLLAYISSPAYI
jgi:hypothetical protein